MSNSNWCDWCTPNGSDGVLCCAKDQGHDGPHMTVYESCGGVPYSATRPWMDAEESKRWLERGALQYVRNQPAPRSGT